MDGGGYLEEEDCLEAGGEEVCPRPACDRGIYIYFVEQEDW